jgi:long-chain acyl-CoA synthetase
MDGPRAPADAEARPSPLDAAHVNVARAVERVARRHPARPALRFQGRTVTYAELDDAAGRHARVFAACGVVRGARVALLLPNGPEFVAAYLGALKLGAVAVSLSPAWPGEEAARALGHAEPTVLVTDAEHLAALGTSRADGLRHVLVVDADGEAADARALAPLLAEVTGGVASVEMWRDEPAAILYSSGTTALPKGVVLSHGNVVGCARAKVRCCGIRDDDGLSLFVPLAHCYGQNAVLNAAFAGGACVVLHRRFGEEAVARSVDADGMTMLFGVPPVFARLLDAGLEREMRRVRYAFSAAATMPLPVAERWREAAGTTVHEGYGLTETSPFACYNHVSEPRAGTVGTPIPGVEVRIGSVADGGAVEEGAAGEVLVRGPNVMLGYWRRPDLTRDAMRGGWLRTGDLGRMDERGYLVLEDRLREVVNVAGFKVFPAQVDRVLHLHPRVAEAAAYGTPDGHGGERVEAAVVLRGGRTEDVQEIVEHCRQRLAGYEVPRRVRVVDALPRNAAGKVLRRLLAEP